ncbi:unnamed protein product [Blepharisma stoltei]|uniref:Receptor ligand binding region domain-containing protein n=1 Tax=Blepharisma stoltei TaxID=1481888 RepID=A0AAU9KET1_9CILI|nr:unnamed protein product [Blepharisma stoltei]
MTLFFYIILQLLCSSERIDILSSEATSNAKTELMILSVKNYFPSYFEIEASQINSTEPIIDLLSTTYIVIDITDILAFQWKLAEAAQVIGFVHIIVGVSSDQIKGLEYFPMLPLRAHYEALSSILSYLNWYQYNLIYNESKDAINLKNLFIESQATIHDFCYPSGNSLDVTSAFIGREVKPTGLTNLVVLSEGKSANQLVNSIIDNKMYVKNSGIILWSKAIWGPTQDGLIIIVQEGLELASSLEEYEVTSLMHVFQQINLYNQNIDL